MAHKIYSDNINNFCISAETLWYHLIQACTLDSCDVVVLGTFVYLILVLKSSKCGAVAVNE